jgi:hypothetical protein
MDVWSHQRDDPVEPVVIIMLTGTRDWHWEQ